METKNITSQRKSIGLGAALLAVLLILVLTLAPTPAEKPQAATNIQPVLLAMAVEQPDAQVRVIVQKSDVEGDIKAAITRLDGMVINDLHIINAVVAQLPAGHVSQLAQANGVRWVSLDGAVESSKKPPKDDTVAPAVENYYLDTLGVRDVWDMGIDGEGVTVAVIDSGIADMTIFYADPESNNSTRILDREAFNSDLNLYDNYGHGSHVAGIVAGNGQHGDGTYIGIAPMANLLSLNISNYEGMAYESDTVAAMQWVLDNKDVYNIRVVNLSINSATEQSYHTSPMDAAAEILWFNGVVVVASAGNKGDGIFNTANSAPANDPFIITVGASDEKKTSDPSDDVFASFSAFGITDDGFNKPEIVAPGTDIMSVLASNSDWGNLYPERIDASGKYFRLSGTSMSAPIVSGAAALILQNEPHLNPDQVKYRLINSSSQTFDWVEDQGSNATYWSYPYLDVYAAVTSNTTASANTGIEASQLLWSGDEPIAWSSVNWGSVNWGSVNWGSVNWGSVNWGSVNWGSVSWDD